MIYDCPISNKVGTDDTKVHVCILYELMLNYQTSNRCRRQCRQDTRDQGTDGQSGNITRPTRGNLRQDTNLRAQRSNVAETTESICCDQSGTGGEVGVHGVAGQGGECDEFVLEKGG